MNTRPKHTTQSRYASNQGEDIVHSPWRHGAAWCFKANSSILNSLLTLLNERRFHNDGVAIDCPLQTLVGASNELPESKELDALYDRFLIRFWVDYIKDRDALKAVMMDAPGKPMTAITTVELELAQDGVSEVDIGESIVDRLLEVKQALEKEGFKSSDRRWVGVLQLLRASAYLERRDEVTEDDLLLLSDVLWYDPKDRSALSAVISKIANPAASAAQEMVDAAREAFALLPDPTSTPAEMRSSAFDSCSSANAQFKRSLQKLEKLGDSKVVAEALAEIARLYDASSAIAKQLMNI